jgi:hypothetical protein
VSRLRRAGPLLAVVVAAACSVPAPGSGPTTPTVRPTPSVASAPPVPEATTAPAPARCRTGWGSLATAAPGLGRAPVVAVRTSADPCADRVEFELDGAAAGYSVSYVDEVVQDGSGDAVPVPGAARLQVQLHHPAYDDAGQATLPGRAGEPLPSVSGYSALRSVVFAGSFEGYSTFGVGVRARLPFRISVVDGPDARSRIVLEVAHSWT